MEKNIKILITKKKIPQKFKNNQILNNIYINDNLFLYKKPKYISIIDLFNIYKFKIIKLLFIFQVFFYYQSQGKYYSLFQIR